MSIVFQMDKRTGIKYAYENEAYWDKEKKQSRSKRTLIGKVDPETGEIIPTRPYHKKAEEAVASIVKPGPVPIAVTNRRFFGATTPWTAARCLSWRGGSIAMNISISRNRGGTPMTMNGSAENTA